MPSDINSGVIFVSYRRDDSQGFAGRLTDDLSDQFGEEQIFRDDEIREGRDFVAVLARALRSCQVMIVVIGDEWINARDTTGQRRLSNPDDWVRLEIEAALGRGVWVIPVLVSGAAMPAAAQLPPTLAALSRVQAFELSDRDWDHDIEQLAALLCERVPALARARAIRTAAGPERTRPSPLTGVGRHLGRLARLTVRKTPRLALGLLKRLVSMGVVLLLGYFVLERYATEDVQAFVYGFLDFAWTFVQALPGHLASALSS